MTYTGTPPNYNSTSSAYTGSIVIPNSVEYGGRTYSVTTIYSSAFYGCTGLTSITIPNSVTTIYNSAFYGCTGLTSVTIGNSVTNIGDYAFYNCRGLTSITIPNSVTTIYSSAFYGCTGLTSVTIGNSVTSIGGSAFSGCTGLTSISIPNSVTTIDFHAFYNCSKLTKVTLLSDAIVSKSYSSLFDNNIGSIFGSQVKEYILGNKVTSIGGNAFRGCTGLTSLTIPYSVTSIGVDAFRGCRGLTSMKVELGNIVYDSRDNCNAIIETKTNTLISGCQNTIIPNSVTTIGNYAFWDCTGLTSVTIPNSVTSIGSDAFYRCI